MNPANRVLAVLGLTLSTALSQTAELRTFTNAQGKALQARLIGVAGANVTIETANGQRFTLPIASLSAADQQYLKSAPAAPAAKAGPNDKLEPAAVNEAAGQPIFSDTALWATSAEELAEKLQIPPESKTKTTSSFRSYTQKDYRLFGAHPYSVAMYAENGKVTAFSIVFANKGDLFQYEGDTSKRPDDNDAAKLLKKAMDKDVAAISEALTQKLGAPKKERFGEKAGRMNMQRWDWRGHSILLAEAEGEYVGLQIVTTAFADAGGKVEETADKVIRARVLANLQKRDNGDIVVGDLPMVDQGPKGYCVPATAERAMRYLGVPADMYILANAGKSNFGGGTNVDVLLEGIGPQIRSKHRSFDSWTGELKLKDLAKYIDKGVPVMWCLFSTKTFNEVANKRTQERKTTTNWASWKTKVAKEAADSTLEKDRDSAHVVLITGYNKDTNEIAFSDSWGEDFKERWISVPEAERVSQQHFYVVGF